MKELIAKLLKGETLSDEERAKLEAYDPDKEKNDAAAAARKRAEAERDALRAKVEEMTSKAETTAAEKVSAMEGLQKRIAALEADKAKAEKEAGEMKRASTIEALREKHGIKFIDGVSPDITRAAFANAFAGVDDLADETAVAERINTFKDANKGLILDTTGRGTGRNATPSTTAAKDNPFSKEGFNLTRQSEIERNNPAEAERLRAAAN